MENFKFYVSAVKILVKMSLVVQNIVDDYLFKTYVYKANMLKRLVFLFIYNFKEVTR